MPTMTNPNPCIGSAVLDNATDGSALFRALGGHYTSPAQAVCEFIDDSLSSIAANGDEVGEVFLRVTDRGELVELSVTDSGSGIADLGAALTISDRSVAQTPYNEHGCGLKSALSHLCGGAEDWSIETRTADDAAADRYRCVSAPYAAVNAHMTERIYAGSGDIPWVTGTIVRLRCPMPRFAQLKPASRRTPADFCQLVDYLAEELRYTYAPLLASGQLILSILRCEQNGHEQLLSLDALEPEWDGDAVELPETKLDLGGGPVTVRCRYGLIIKSKSNAVYYRDTPLTLADERIARAIRENSARLVIIDPVQAFLGADVDMNRANEVRPIFRSLGDIAQATGCAIVLIGHLNKAAGTQSTYRGLGSIDITAAVRSLLFIGKLKDSPTTRVLIHEKSSLAPPGQSIAFSLGDEKGFAWIGAYDITADELLAGTDTAKTESKTAQAQMLILELLADGKRMPSAELEKAVNERGISSRTMRTAKSRIGDRLVTEKDGTAWVCYLRD